MAEVAIFTTNSSSVACLACGLATASPLPFKRGEIVVARMAKYVNGSLHKHDCDVDGHRWIHDGYASAQKILIGIGSFRRADWVDGDRCKQVPQPYVWDSVRKIGVPREYPGQELDLCA